MEFNLKTMKPFFLLVAFGVLLYWGLQNLSFLSSILGAVLGLIAPFLLGGCIAFILTVPMKRIETMLFPKPTKISQKIKRPFSLLLTLILLLALIGVVFGLIIPELGNSFLTLRNNVIRFLVSFEQQHPAFLDQFVSYLPTAEELAAVDWEGLAKKALSFLGSGAGSLINSTVSVASHIFNGLLTFFIGFVFSIYLLLQKEKVGRQVKQLLYAYLPEKAADRILSIAGLSSKTFASFLSGQCTEAVILGLLFFICMTIFRFPYALMISVLIAVTALIPIFGAFIGCFIGCFMILMTSPIKMLWFIVLFLTLQQLEGNLIYPKVMGKSLGMPAIWVFAAGATGGSASVESGMMLFIPLCSVLYTLLRENSQERLKRKKIAKQKLL